MRIAFLCKRRYMSKDVIVDRYARLYEIPYQLARLGHDVRGWCLGYGDAEEGEWEHAAAPGRLRWQSRSLGRWKLPTLLGYPRHLAHRLHAFRPDLVIGASDIPHVAWGARLAQRLRVPYAADLYDNFEGFGQARIPGFVPALRRAVRHADLVTTTSSPLRDFVIDTYKARGEVIAMPSTIDKSVFHPRDRAECRRALGLPPHAKLIGTAGGLYADKGVGVLYDAWKLLAARQPDVHLVVAGPTDPRLPPPADQRVHALGLLPHARIAELFAALDVGVVYLRDTPFGRYCFPQKACEMFACGLPVAAARVGVMTDLLSTVPDALYRPDDAADLARAVQVLLDKPARPDVAIEDWTQVIGRLERELRALVTHRPA
ncbi:MAG: glycosyltransferase family 4 protein [Proteobacteria bacterium]|nr:glycosyltransferase family 4 protein [Pseudomonadota bacterium]